LFGDGVIVFEGVGACVNGPLDAREKRLCRDFLAGEMSGLLSRAGAAISMLMEVKQRWEPGPGIRVVDAEFRGERWIVKAEDSGDARWVAAFRRPAATVSTGDGYRICPSWVRLSNPRSA
jgi:hypothetical protein